MNSGLSIQDERIQPLLPIIYLSAKEAGELFCRSHFPAPLVTGLAHYREDGIPNLLIASDQFKKFRDSYEDERDLDDLVQVACLDMSYILVEVMHASASELQMLISLKGGDNATQAQIDLATKTMTNAEQGAFRGIYEFLYRWPNSQYAADARASLPQVEDFLDDQMMPLLLRKVP